MVKQYETDHHRSKNKNNVKADVIILGTTLPGIVAAHKLKKKFGDEMDIVVLDLAKAERTESQFNVAFQINEDESEIESESELQPYIKNIARQYITKYACDLHIPLPDAIIAPETIKNPLTKLFQYSNGSAVACERNYHDFSYLNVVERFELNQYQALLDGSMRQLFVHKCLSADIERKRLQYYDRTTMETHICDALLFPNSRELQRLVVRLVCGATADTVSVLFYLHQCYRVCGCTNHLDGANMRLREKLLGYCRRRINNRLKQSVADITLLAKPIRFIRTHSDEEVIIETMKGDTNYVCSLLAMAMRPDDLKNINVDEELYSSKKAELYRSMVPGSLKKFVINYHDDFWRENGYSGDIVSMHGPIIWATEKPKLSTTGSEEKFAALIGYLKIGTQSHLDSREAVVAQLVKLFGEKAATPANYKETDVSDIYIPRSGDYVAMQHSDVVRPAAYRLEWRTLDVFADGDVAAALEAGHSAYLHLMRLLRPQAQTYDDLKVTNARSLFEDVPFRRWLSRLNFKVGVRLAILSAAVVVGARALRHYMGK